MQKKWRLPTLILGPLMIALFAWVGLIPFFAEHFTWIAVVILTPVSVVVTLWFTYMFLDYFSYKFTITDNQFLYQSIVTNQYLNFVDVRGFSIDEHYIRIEPRVNRSRRIEISRYTGDVDEILNFLRQRFELLGYGDAFYEIQEILSDKEFGYDHGSRLKRLKLAKRIALLMNIIGGCLCAWSFFVPVFFDFLLYTSLVYPLAVLVVVIYFGGLIKVEEKKNSEYPSITFGFALAICGFAVRVLDFEIVDYDQLWVYSMIPFAVVFALFLAAAGSIERRSLNAIITMLILVGFIVIYSACSCITVNCLLDEGEPASHQAKVLEKTVSKRKRTTYYILLEPWGPIDQPKTLSVSQAEYDRVDVGEEVQIFLKGGSLGIPWYYFYVN